MKNKKIKRVMLILLLLSLFTNAECLEKDIILGESFKEPVTFDDDFDTSPCINCICNYTTLFNIETLESGLLLNIGSGFYSFDIIQPQYQIGNKYTVIIECRDIGNTVQGTSCTEINVIREESDNTISDIATIGTNGGYFEDIYNRITDPNDESITDRLKKLFTPQNLLDAYEDYSSATIQLLALFGKAIDTALKGAYLLFSLMSDVINLVYDPAVYIWVLWDKYKIIITTFIGLNIGVIILTEILLIVFVLSQTHDLFVFSEKYIKYHLDIIKFFTKTIDGILKIILLLIDRLISFISLFTPT